MEETNSLAVPIRCFRNVIKPSFKILKQKKFKKFFFIILFKPHPKHKNEFKVGMMLEGMDIKHPSLICVLSVSQVLGYRIRLHFDGYDYCHDFWRNIDSDKIFPVGYCKKNNLKLTPPLGLKLVLIKFLSIYLNS